MLRRLCPMLSLYDREHQPGIQCPQPAKVEAHLRDHLLRGLHTAGTDQKYLVQQIGGVGEPN